MSAVVSVFDLFKVGIGPSSSHTVGPMRAAAAFVAGMDDVLPHVARVRVDLYGSLAWTGAGHGTDRAVVLGLAGELPDTLDPARADRVTADAASGRLLLAGRREIAFDPDRDVVFDRSTPTPTHPNTLAFTVSDDAGEVLRSERWCSVGGGFVLPERRVGEAPGPPNVAVPFPYDTAGELLAHCARQRRTVAEIVRANEHAARPPAELARHLTRVEAVMSACIDRGLVAGGCLPGKLGVRRRAPGLYAALAADEGSNRRHAHEIMEHVSLWAIAVNEENAAGGQVVTAPTNGAAGVIPAVLRYWRRHCLDASDEGAESFLLTAAAVGGLCKRNASISGAEVGCQGEVGSACAMAAAGLAAALGGTPGQVENAAEIGMEHHLGMTCDPVGGLVQIPCIERNAFGAVKAINAASLALRGDGGHVVSLDQVIATMRATGADMHAKYKETSRGGLAVAFPEC